MRRRIFLDTGYLIALIRKKDACHAVALEAAELYAGPFLTADLVLVELANSLSKPPYRKSVVAVIEKIQADRKTLVKVDRFIIESLWVSLAIKDGLRTPLNAAPGTWNCVNKSVSAKLRNKETTSPSPSENVRREAQSS